MLQVKQLIVVYKTLSPILLCSKPLLFEMWGQLLDNGAVQLICLFEDELQTLPVFLQSRGWIYLQNELLRNVFLNKQFEVFFRSWLFVLLSQEMVVQKSKGYIGSSLNLLQVVNFINCLRQKLGFGLNLLGNHSVMNFLFLDSSLIQKANIFELLQLLLNFVDFLGVLND